MKRTTSHTVASLVLAVTMFSLLLGTLAVAPATAAQPAASPASPTAPPPLSSGRRLPRPAANLPPHLAAPSNAARPVGGFGYLSGNVQDSYGQPLSATLRIGAALTLTTEPGSIGSYSVTLPTGSYSFAVSASGCYLPLTQTVTVVPGSNVVSFTLPDAPADAFGYNCFESAGGYLPASNRVLANNFNQEQRPFTLTMPLNYYGQIYYTGTITGKGYIQIGSTISGTAALASNPCLPNASQPNGVVAANWDDLVGDSSNPTAGVFTDVIGSSPDRFFIVEWRGVAHAGQPGITSTFQLQVSEGTGDVLYIYRQMNGRSNGSEASAGIESYTGGSGLQIRCNAASSVGPNYLYSGLSINLYSPIYAIPTNTPTSTAPASPTIMPTATASPIPTSTVTNTASATNTSSPVVPTATPAPATCLSEGFANVGSLVGSGWVIQNNSQPLGSSSWFQGDSASFPAQAGAADAYAAANFSSVGGTSGTISTWLLTPPRPLNNGDTLRFWSRTVDAPAFPDRLEVRLSSNGSSSNVGSIASSVGNFTTTLLTINPALTVGGYPSTWTAYSATISGLAGPSNGRVGFRYFVTGAGSSGANGDYIGLDSLSLCPIATTPTATATATATGVATNTATSTSTFTATATSTSTLTATATSTSSLTATATLTLTATATATLMVTSTATSTASPCLLTFSDVPTNNIFYGDIQFLACRGIVSGANGLFRPNDTARRGEFAKIAVLAFAIPNFTPTVSTFNDVAISSIFYGYIEAAAHAVVVNGLSSSQCAVLGVQPPCYGPNVNISRVQVAAIVQRARAYPPVTPGAATFSDLPATGFGYNAVETLASRAIISGAACLPPATGLCFRPNDNIRRGELAKVVHRAMSSQP